MHIFTAGDRNYILGLAALLKSIDLNVSKSGQEQVKITIVSTGIAPQQKEQLQNCCKYQIEWQELQSSYDQLLSLSGSKLAYVKLQPEKYTKETERLIWLDSDTIVLGSLDPLWNLDLQTMPIAAAPNVWGNTNNSQDRNPYFNTGVLVYNMKLWEEEQLSEKLMENARLNLWGDHDQGALNSVLAGRWKQLDQIWKNHKTDDMSSKVMHFMSRPKPWESSTPNQLWLDMLSQTPFKDEVEKIPKNFNWLSRFKIKYRAFGQWLREPTTKFKSYLKKQKR
ncbi:MULTISPECIES: glycosyltransferase [unclassified Microcoleus]|uniref:glycosyltransferase n=1 Tax=unclassified Microcoleus TaxID=2642155 RepID=UPI002FCF5C1A